VEDVVALVGRATEDELIVLAEADGLHAIPVHRR
jgi:hypothetical protein